MDQKLRIVRSINSLLKSKDLQQKNTEILLKARDYGFPVYSVYKLIQTQYLLKNKTQSTLSEEGWVYLKNERIKTKPKAGIKSKKLTQGKRSSLDDEVKHNQVIMSDEGSEVMIEADFKKFNNPDKEIKKRKGQMILNILVVIILILILFMRITKVYHLKW